VFKSRPPRKLPGLTDEQNSAVFGEFDRLLSTINGLVNKPLATPQVHSEAIVDAKVGDLLQLQPKPAGQILSLPPAATTEIGAEILVQLDSSLGGTLTVMSVANIKGATVRAGTVNGEARSTYNSTTLLRFVSDGKSCWYSGPTATALDAGLDAEVVLGAAHADLPNGRVATDSAEIDAVLTTPNVITWALNTASVAFSKLVNLAGLSVLGRSASSSGVMAAITATAGSQRLSSTTDGTSLEWHTLGGTEHEVSLTGTLTDYVLPATMQPGDTLAVTLTGNVTLNSIVPPLGVTTNFWFFLALRDQSGGNFALTIADVGAFATGKAFRTPGQPFGGAAVSYVMQSEEEACVISYSSTVGVAIWRIISGTAAQAITGPITVSAGNGGSRASAIAASVAGAGLTLSGDVLAVGAGTRITVNANDVQLAAGAAESFLMNATAGSAVADYRAGSSVAGGGLTYTAGGTLAVGAGTGITVNANDVAVTIPLTDGDKGDITVASSGTSWTVDALAITPTKIAAFASNFGVVGAVFYTAAAGAGGAADDVTLQNANMPFAVRWLEWRVIVTTAVALATVEVRSANGGGGAALSSTFVAATAGEAALSASWTATTTSAVNTSSFLRRSDSGVALDLVGYYVRT
jgi:hypothetical protein